MSAIEVALDVSAVPPRPAGAGRYIVELASRLSLRDDVDPVLVCSRGDEGRWHETIPHGRLLPLVPRRRPLRLAWEQVAAPLVAWRRHVEVWHGPHYTMPLAWPGPKVVTVHDLTFFDHPELHEPVKARYFRRMIRLAARRASVLVCVSEPTAQRLQDLLRPRAPIVVAPHGIDLSRFRPTPPDGVDDEDVLRALGIDVPFVAFVGTVEPRKNVVGLIAAMEVLSPDVALVIAGQDGWGTEPVDAAIASSTRRIIRLGYVDDAIVPSLYRRAAAVAYPAIAEGFGLPALEAVACGAPVVTTEGTPMADAVDGAALPVPAGDIGALGEALRALVDGGGPEPTTSPVIAARFSWDVSVDRHVEAYRMAAAHRSSATPSGDE